MRKHLEVIFVYVLGGVTFAGLVLFNMLLMGCYPAAVCGVVLMPPGA